MPQIKYLKGDATNPVNTDGGPAIICHICNDLGAWGAGFVLAVSRKWAQPEASYRAKKEYILGTVEIVRVEPNIHVANMIGQHGVMPRQTPEFITEPPIRYEALRAALEQVDDFAYKLKGTIHMPRIGCGLAGGKWEEIEKIISEVCTQQVYVYDLP